jgi:heavy metal translocating P-type ATPase
LPEQTFALTRQSAIDTVPALEQETCLLCGLPYGGVVAAHVAEGTVHGFCCPGCRQVYLILSGGSGGLPADYRETEIYRACVQANIIPDGKSALPAIFPTAASEDPASDLSPLEPGAMALELSFRVDGMWCPACAWLIGRVLGRIAGVLDPRVSFFSDTVGLRYFPHVVSPKEITSTIGKLGYKVSPMGEKSSRGGAKGDLLLRLGVSSILTMNAMMLSCALYFGFIRDLAPTVVAYLSYPLLAMTAPVVFYGGLPILRKAWASIRHGRPSMDTLIAIGILAAFGYSLIGMARGSIHLYFDTAAMLVTIVLLGRYIEIQARERVLSMVGAGPDEIGPQKVRIAGLGTERWIAGEAVRPGDRFIVRPGERIALDGHIVAGQGLLDQSVITGEPAPVVRGSEEEVTAGSLLVEGELEIAATRSARDSSLQQMADLMVKALDRKNSGEQLADAVSRLFVPLIMAITAFTAYVLWFFSVPAEEILLRCLTMLLISCPCALGVAVPLVKVAIMGLGCKKGILIKNPDALEGVLNLDTIILDKTGTMTEGKFMLLHVICEEADEKEVLSRIAPVEAGSSHSLAREILRHTRELGLSVEKGFAKEEYEGLGVTGIVGNEAVFAGNRRLLARANAEIAASLEGRAGEHEGAGMTVVLFGWGGKARGFFVFGDRLRHGAKELVEQLRRRGLRVVLLSGDGVKTTGATAHSLGITDYLGQAVPVEKTEFVRNIQREGHKVGMVGDGINDAGALAQADVSFAMGSGHDITNEASDVIIRGGKPGLIIDAFEISTLSVRTTRQNLCFAFLYNSTAIPVAAAGLLNPLIAVLAMFMSSLTVIGNTLRLSRTGKRVTYHGN